MKIYVHYEGSGPPSTTGIDTEMFQTLEELINAVVASHRTQTRSSLDAACVELSTIDGEKLWRYGDTIKRCCEFIAVQDCADILLVDCKRRAVQMPKSQTSTTQKSAPSSSSSHSPTSKDMESSQLITQSVKVAQKYMEKAYFKKARETVQEGLKALARIKVKDCSLNELMCEILLAAKKYEEAVDYAEKSVEIATSLKDGDNRTGSTKKYLYFMLARAHFEAGNLEDCFAFLKKCTDELGGFTAIGSATATMLTEDCAKPSQKPHVKNKRVHFPWFHLDIAALRAECLFAIGKHIEAADVVNGCMADPHCEQHMGVLLAYSSFAAHCGKIQEAMRSLLKVVVVDQTEKRGRRLLSSLLSSEEGIKEVQQQLAVGSKSSSAYGFLAMLAKDHSCIPASKAMMEFALGGNPTNVGYLLNLMHVIELKGPGKYAEALQCCESFLGIHGAMVRVGASNSGGFSSADLLAAMRGEDHSGRVSYADQLGSVVDWTPGDGEYETSRPDDDDEVALANRSYGYARVLSLCKDPNTGKYYLIEEDGQEQQHVDEDHKELYDNDSLDLLAVAFTIVKLFYLQGRLDRLPALFRCIERSRRMSREPLHETSIRNEHAYYQCIAQVLAYRLSCSEARVNSNGGSSGNQTGMGITHPFPVSPLLAAHAELVCPDLSNEGKGIPSTTPGANQYQEAAKAPLYVVGDSHVMSLAWSIVNIAGTPRLLVPRLTTGIKHYHLRADSDFYPKYQFNNNLKNIPDSSDILFILGEIDCREGLLVAVEKDQYSSLTTGMQTTLKHFIDVLSPLYKQRKMKNIYVHPVLPILKETRTIVGQYNQLYETAVTQAAGRIKPTKGGSLQWLDFYHSLFRDGVDLAKAAHIGEEGELLEGLKMDGTHISPNYTHLLERALNT